jgi:hypothetical protein
MNVFFKVVEAFCPSSGGLIRPPPSPPRGEGFIHPIHLEQKNES